MTAGNVFVNYLIMLTLNNACTVLKPDRLITCFLSNQNDWAWIPGLSVSWWCWFVFRFWSSGYGWNLLCIVWKRTANHIVSNQRAGFNMVKGWNHISQSTKSFTTKQKPNNYTNWVYCSVSKLLWGKKYSMVKSNWTLVIGLIFWWGSAIVPLKRGLLY